ncbi:MAG: hypothetical protein ACRD21_01265 [Vicinamibacteria bacterium]
METLALALWLAGGVIEDETRLRNAREIAPSPSAQGRDELEGRVWPVDPEKPGEVFEP